MIRFLRAWSLEQLASNDDLELIRASTGRDVPRSDAWACAVIMRNNARRDQARALLRPRIRHDRPTR